MKLAYEHDMSQPLGASYMPGNVLRDERGSAGMGASMPGSGAFNEMRAVANRSGQDKALAHFGVKRSSLTQPGTPKTNVDTAILKKPNPDKFPDAGTGYATSGAQYGADTRK